MTGRSLRSGLGRLSWQREMGMKIALHGLEAHGTLGALEDATPSCRAFNVQHSVTNHRGGEHHFRISRADLQDQLFE